MKSLLKRSLVLKVLFIEFIGVSIILIPKTYFDFKQRAELYTKSHEAKLVQVQRTLENGLLAPLWNFSPEDADPVLSSIIQNPEIKKIRVTDSNDATFIEKIAPTWEQAPEIDRDTVVQHFNIYREGHFLGEVELQSSKEHLNSLIQNAVFELLLLNSLVIALVIAGTFLLIRKSIIDPIKQLLWQSNKLKLGQWENKFNWSAGDEMNELGIALESVRIALIKSFKNVQDKNNELEILNENLEKTVVERSILLTESSRLASLGEMAGGIAHEINNPLAIISGKSQRIRRLLLEGDSQNKETLMGDLNKIDQTIERIAKIIQGLRSFSRDGAKDDFSCYPVKDICENTLELCRSRFHNAGIELTLPDVDNKLHIECRPVQIEQVLLNLLNNAFDAVSGLAVKWVKVSLTSSETDIELSVTDSGNGIPTSVQSKLMQPFFTTKPVGKGTGLGLSICKGIVESHGGQFTYDTSSKNTRFVVCLPKEQSFTKHQNHLQKKSA